MKIAVVAALAEELAPLSRRLADRRPPRPGRSWSCLADGHELTVMTTGDGARCALRSVEELFTVFEPSLLIGIGCAGAATGGLGAGELLAAERVFEQASGAVVIPPDSPWLRRARTLRGVVAGSIVSLPRIARSPEAKARAARAASDGPVVIDLESWSWARTATDNGVPFVLLRGVTDALHERLPLDFEGLRDAGGSVDRGRVLLAASFRPASWPGLLSLRRRLRAVAERLAECTLEVAAA